MADWRLRGQESYLKNVTLYAAHFVPLNESEQQTHCSFCWGKMSEIKDGYHTKDRKRWVCAKCFADFCEAFSWTVKESEA